MVRASLIWLNYNSSGFIDITLRSIGSALRLDFDYYEVVIVDNASSDCNFERIRKFIEEKKPSNVRVKFVKSDANRGLCRRHKPKLESKAYVPVGFGLLHYIFFA